MQSQLRVVKHRIMDEMEASDYVRGLNRFFKRVNAPYHAVFIVKRRSCHPVCCGALACDAIINVLDSSNRVLRTRWVIEPVREDDDTIVNRVILFVIDSDGMVREFDMLESCRYKRVGGIDVCQDYVITPYTSG